MLTLIMKNLKREHGICLLLYHPLLQFECEGLWSYIPEHMLNLYFSSNLLQPNEAAMSNHIGHNPEVCNTVH